MRRLVVPSFALVGCLGVLEQPEVGLVASDSTCDAEHDPMTPVSFAGDIVPILTALCTRCHRPGSTGESESGLDLTSYDALLAGGARSVDTIVIAGRPCASVLYQKVTDAPPFGARMPRGLSPLSSSERSLLHDWITEGAHDN